MDKFFLIQIKRTNGAIEKGIVVKDTADAAFQGMYAYLGAYGYGKDANTDYVQVGIIDSNAVNITSPIVWKKAEETTPEE